MQSSQLIDNSASKIHDSHLLNGSVEDLVKYYHSWAVSYDDDVSDELYCGPEVISSIVTAVHDAFGQIDRTALKVLDAGCGTGLVGRALRSKGYNHIDGFDLSPEMAAIAENTGAYSDVRAEVNLNEPLSEYAKSAYDLTVCCGVFTLGHVKAQSLAELIRATKPGGFIVVSTRKSYFDTSGFHDVVQSLIDDGQIEQTACYKDALYIAEEGAHYWVFRVCGPSAVGAEK